MIYITIIAVVLAGVAWYLRNIEYDIADEQLRIMAHIFNTEVNKPIDLVMVSEDGEEYVVTIKKILHKKV